MRGHQPKVGGKVGCTFAHKNWYFTATNYVLFLEFCIHAWKNRRIKPAAFISSFRMPYQRRSPRGLILKYLASRNQVLENYPVLGSRTAIFLELLKFCSLPEKNFWRPCFLENAWKFFLMTFFWRKPEKKFWRPFFWRTLAPVSLVLGLERVYPRKGCPWPWLGFFLCSWPWPRALCPRLHLFAI